MKKYILGTLFTLCILISPVFVSPVEAASTTWAYTNPAGQSCGSGQDGYDNCTPYPATDLASFGAADGQTETYTYAPGAKVSVSVLAGGGGGSSFIGADLITHQILNFLFGSATKAVGAEAYFNEVIVAHCAATGSCTGSGTFTAPSIPGTYTIHLRGWWYKSEQNESTHSFSDMSFKVACASGTNWNGSSCVSCASPNTWNSTTKTCDVPIAPGACGTANAKTYPSGTTGYSPDTQCSVGNVENTNFPPAGGSSAWLCNNNGSYSPMCQAWRSAAATPAPVVTSMTVDGSTGSLTTCPGVSHALAWSATNVGGTCGGFGYAPVGASPNAGGSTSFSATSNGTISYNCPNSAGVWGTQRNINVSVVDGSSCVVPVTAPTVTVSWTPSSITAGDSSKITVTPSDSAATCTGTLTGPSPVGATILPKPYPWTNTFTFPTQGTETANASCTNAGSTGTASAVLTINPVGVTNSAPTASFFINGQSSATNVDPLVSRTWSWNSTNGSSYKASAIISGCDTASQNGPQSNWTPWTDIGATGNATSGSSATIPGAVKYGCTIVGTYNVTKDGKTTTATATITFKHANATGIYNLTVTPAGTGTGMVTSAPVGAAFTSGTSVTLTANPDTSSTFAGWSGACTNTTGTCVVTMSGDKSVTATFNTAGSATTYPLNVTVSPSTGGYVSISNLLSIACGGGSTICSANISSGTTVPLIEYAKSGYTFAGWSGGGCSGTEVACFVTMNQAQNVTATFNTAGSATTYPLTVTTNGTGIGEVHTADYTIYCGMTGTYCSKTYSSDTSVTLTETPNAVSTFAGWSGACSGTGTCTVTMNQAQNVTATFTSTSSVSGTYTLTVAISGTGSGAVSSGIAGIACNREYSAPLCSASYLAGTRVPLIASELSGTFAGWSGACTGMGGCTVTMSSNQSLTATFTSSSLSKSFSSSVSAAPHITSISPTSSKVGTTITITGSGFTGTNSIYLNGSPVDTLNSSGGSTPTWISFVIPTNLPSCPSWDRICTPGPALTSGTYTVSVQNTNGTSNAVSLGVN